MEKNRTKRFRTHLMRACGRSMVMCFPCRASKERWVKLAFDKMLRCSHWGRIAILCAIFAAHFVLALFIPDQRGRL
jgi:hypothetical protein